MVLSTGGSTRSTYLVLSTEPSSSRMDAIHSRLRWFWIHIATALESADAAIYIIKSIWQAAGLQEWLST